MGHRKHRWRQGAILAQAGKPAQRSASLAIRCLWQMLMVLALVHCECEPTLCQVRTSPVAGPCLCCWVGVAGRDHVPSPWLEGVPVGGDPPWAVPYTPPAQVAGTLNVMLGLWAMTTIV